MLSLKRLLRLFLGRIIKLFEVFEKWVCGKYFYKDIWYVKILKVIWMYFNKIFCWIMNVYVCFGFKIYGILNIKLKGFLKKLF